jgi:hypothetical protein
MTLVRTVISSLRSIAHVSSRFGQGSTQLLAHRGANALLHLRILKAGQVVIQPQFRGWHICVRPAAIRDFRAIPIDQHEQDMGMDQGIAQRILADGTHPDSDTSSGRIFSGSIDDRKYEVGIGITGDALQVFLNITGERDPWRAASAFLCKFLIRLHRHNGPLRSSVTQTLADDFGGETV